MTLTLMAAGALVVTDLSWRTLGAGAVVMWGLLSAPVLLVPVGALWLGQMGWARLRQRSRERMNLRVDEASLAEMTALALSGGLGIYSALEMAADGVGGPVGATTTDLLRRIRVDGVVAATTAGGAGSDLFRTIGRAAASGAPLVDPVTRIAGEMRSELAADRLEDVRRIPVAMLFPLTLLILPGFLLLTVAPALVDAFARLRVLTLPTAPAGPPDQEKPMTRLRTDQTGQATAEYALVVVAAAAIAGTLIVWATSTGALGALFDAVISRVSSFM